MEGLVNIQINLKEKKLGWTGLKWLMTRTHLRFGVKNDNDT
jgi:hypothetical protein